jgi:outer membrane protein assembly factor BamB
MIPLALFFYGCYSRTDIVIFEYKKGDWWVENFRDGNFTAKAFWRDKIYCSSIDIGNGRSNQFYCLNLKTGRVDWAAAVGNWASQPPIVNDSFIYYCSYTGDIYRFEPEEGKQIWKTKLESPYGGHCLNVFNNNLLVGTVTNGLFEYDCHTGTKASHIGATSLGMPLPVFYDGLVLFAGINNDTTNPGRGGYSVCKRAADGEELWRRDIGRISGDKIIADSGRLYFFDDSARLRGLDIMTGMKIWRSDSAENYRGGRYASDPHLVFFKNEIINFDTFLDTVFEFDKSNGNFLGLSTYQKLLSEYKIQVHKYYYTVADSNNHSKYLITVTDSLEIPDDYAKTFHIKIQRE